MKNSTNKKKVFFDANVIIGRSKDEKKTWRIKLRFLYAYSDVELLTTDITRVEVAKNRAEKICNKLQPLSNEDVSKLARDIFSMDIQTINKEDMHEKAYDYFLKEITEETSGPHWTCLECKEVDLPGVFMEYGNKRGFFKEGAKKFQFADAIVFELLKEEATDKTPVIIVSRDKDFDVVTEYSGNVKHVKSWAELIDVLGVTENIPEVDDVVEKCESYIVEQALYELIKIWRETIWGQEEILGQEESQEVRVSNVKISRKSGIRSEKGVIIFGEMQIFYELPKGTPALIAQYQTRLNSKRGIESSKPTEPVCDILFAIVSEEIESQDIVVWIELEFVGNGRYMFLQIPNEADN